MAGRDLVLRGGYEDSNLVAALHRVDDGCSDLTVDFADVTFMTASAMSALSHARQRYAQTGRTLHVVNPRLGLRRVFDKLRIEWEAGAHAPVRRVVRKQSRRHET